LLAYTKRGTERRDNLMALILVRDKYMNVSTFVAAEPREFKPSYIHGTRGVEGQRKG